MSLLWPTQIKSVELVPGDVVLVKSGDIIPADLRLITSADLKGKRFYHSAQALLLRLAAPMAQLLRALGGALIRACAQ